MLPPSVTSIGNEAFNYCTSLANIEIPPSVTSIGKWAFNGCESLNSIVIPPSVKSIGERAFEGCTSLANIVIPSSVTSIDNYAFRGCKSLNNIVIPPSVKSIGERAFYDCTSLTNIVIPPSVAELGEGIFKSCNSLRSIDLTSQRALEESSEPNLFTHAIKAMTPNNMEEWVKTRAQDGRLPLCTAAAASLKWKYIQLIFEANMVAIYERDVVTGLSPFMLSAVGINSDLESVYRLCREYPVAILH